MVMTRAAGAAHNAPMNRFRLARCAWPLLLPALLLPLPALAWNAAGHRLVACIAWDLLDQRERATVSQLLQRHPDYARWQQRASDAHPASAVDRAAFIAASTWPDEIRKDSRFYSEGRDSPSTTLAGFHDMERRSDWHYLAWPLTDPAAPHGAPVYGRIDQAFGELLPMLGAGDDAGRSYALPWLIHLVGDAHQPLHTTLKIDAQGKPDRLGTGLSVRNPFAPRSSLTTLHAYWDELPGPGGLRGEALDDACRTLAAGHARPAPSTPTQWLEESWQIARQGGYPRGDERVPTISGEFNENARQIANRRVAQAGYRLAELLREWISRPLEAKGRID